MWPTLALSSMSLFEIQLFFPLLLLLLHLLFVTPLSHDSQHTSICRIAIIAEGVWLRAFVSWCRCTTVLILHNWALVVGTGPLQAVQTRTQHEISKDPRPFRDLRSRHCHHIPRIRSKKMETKKHGIAAGGNTGSSSPWDGYVVGGTESGARALAGERQANPSWEKILWAALDAAACWRAKWVSRIGVPCGWPVSEDGILRFHLSHGLRLDSASFLVLFELYTLIHDGSASGLWSEQESVLLMHQKDQQMWRLPPSLLYIVSSNCKTPS